MKTLKTQWYLLLIVPFLTLTSCDDDDKNTGLQGIWVPTSTVISGCVDSDLNETEVCTTSACSEVTFTNDQIIGKVGSVPFILSYRVEGNTLITTKPGEAEVVHKMILTKDTLILEGTDNRGEGCITTSTYKRK